MATIESGEEGLWVFPGKVSMMNCDAVLMSQLVVLSYLNFNHLGVVYIPVSVLEDVVMVVVLIPGEQVVRGELVHGFSPTVLISFCS